MTDRYKKCLVTVAMGFRTEEDIEKNGLKRFTKNDTSKLIAFVKKLYNKNKSVLALKIKRRGFRSEHILIKSKEDLINFIDNLNNYYGENNEIWVVDSSVIECWRCRIYLTSDDANDVIEMAYSYDDHILDNISSDSKVPYARYKKEKTNYILCSSSLEQERLDETNRIIEDILNKYSTELRRVKEDLQTIGIKGISLDVRVNNGYDFHDFDVSYSDIKKVIDYYIHQMD